MKMTNWFDITVRPSRHGVYQLRNVHNGEAHYSYWDGRFWCVTCRKASEAAEQSWESPGVASNHYDAWRGLTEDHR